MKRRTGKGKPENQNGLLLYLKEKVRKEYLTLLAYIFVCENIYLLVHYIRIYPEKDISSTIVVGFFGFVIFSAIYLLDKIREWKTAQIKRNLPPGSSRNLRNYLLSPWWVFVLAGIFVGGLKFLNFILGNFNGRNIGGEIFSGLIIYGLLLLVYLIKRKQSWNELYGQVSTKKDP